MLLSEQASTDDHHQRVEEVEKKLEGKLETVTFGSAPLASNWKMRWHFHF